MDSGNWRRRAKRSPGCGSLKSLAVPTTSRQGRSPGSGHRTTPNDRPLVPALQHTSSRMTTKTSSTGKTASADYVRGYETMTRKQIVDIAANRVIIERVKGFLMFVYDIDADTAFELLRRRSRSTHVRVRELAEQVMTDFLAFTAEERLDLRSACSNALLTAHERISPAPLGVEECAWHEHPRRRSQRSPRRT